MNTITRFRQQGLAIVEMAIIGALMMIMLFALLEFGRLLWMWGTLAEVTRHTARAAAVCERDHEAVYNVAVFGHIHGNGSKVLPNLTAANIQVEYGDDADGEPQFVRVSIVDYEIKLAIPIVNLSLTAPPFTTTQPVESLGETITCTVYQP
jgi:hypothetical protein